MSERDDHDAGTPGAPQPRRPRPPRGAQDPGGGGEHAAPDGRPRQPVPPSGGRRADAPPVHVPEPRSEVHRDDDEAGDGPPPGRNPSGYTLYTARRRADDPDAAPRERRRFGRRRRASKRGLPFRIARGILLAAVGWVLLSVVLFLVSAQVHQQGGKVNDLLGGGSAPFGSTNVLIVGTDQRPKGSGDYVAGPSRTDTIMIMKTGGFANSKLSIPRDTVVPLTNGGITSPQKINAAYAFDGISGTVRAVEKLTGVQVNHVAEMDFANFPGLIDAMGGITYKGGCLRAKISGGYKNGGVTLKLRNGDHLDGKQALAVARVRENDCNPAYNDLARGRAQQQVLSQMKKKVLSPSGFMRLPFIAWKAPQAVKTDMSGFSLLGVAIGQFLPGGTTNAQIKPSGTTVVAGGGQGLLATTADVAKAVRKFEK